MKLLLAFLMLFATTAHADLSVGLSKKYARVIYDVSLNGGSSTSHSLNAQLPAGAVITDLYVYINQAFTDSGTGSLALECYGSQDLMAYRDITSNSINDLFSTQIAHTSYTAAAMIGQSGETSAAAAGIASVPSACQVKAVVRSSAGYVPLTAGKLTALIEYFQP